MLQGARGGLTNEGRQKIWEGRAKLEKAGEQANED